MHVVLGVVWEGGRKLGWEGGDGGKGVVGERLG